MFPVFDIFSYLSIFPTKKEVGGNPNISPLLAFEGEEVIWKQQFFWISHLSEKNWAKEPQLSFRVRLWAEASMKWKSTLLKQNLSDALQTLNVLQESSVSIWLFYFKHNHIKVLLILDNTYLFKTEFKGKKNHSNHDKRKSSRIFVNENKCMDLLK